MHIPLLPMAAALTCAFCNGTAVVLQKLSADKQHNTHSLDVRFLLRLIKDVPYFFGIVLDISGYALTIYAVRHLPLYLVQSIIAASIVITALLERFYRHQKIRPRAFIAMGLIVTGLCMLALASSPETARPVGSVLKSIIIFAPLPIAFIGYFVARSKKNSSAVGMAVLAGLAFGGTSVLGRIFTLSTPFWHTIYSPLTFALVADGVIGILLFSTALQRAQATTVNATMAATQTLIPATVGIVFLGDSARNGLWGLVVVGGLVTLVGVTVLALMPQPVTKKPHLT